MPDRRTKIIPAAHLPIYQSAGWEVLRKFVPPPTGHQLCHVTHADADALTGSTKKCGSINSEVSHA